MDFVFTPEQERFRAEIREFLEKEIPPEFRRKPENNWIRGFCPELSRKLGQKGWIGLAWPKKYGGQEKSYMDRLVLTEELVCSGAPVFSHWFGDRQVGPAILAHGTEEQKQKFLTGITRGEIQFGVGMSEPEAGSDLASLQLRAIEEGDHFTINGQKVWTSGIHNAHYIYMVARTDPDTPKHRGISELVVDVNLPGITIRPLKDMTGEYDLNEVFFDNVKAPLDSLIGEKNHGWYQIAEQLDFERSGVERLMSNYPLLRDTVEYVRKAGLNKVDWIRRKLAQLEAEFEVGRLLVYRVAWMLSQGKVPNYEAAMAKGYGTAFEQRLSNAITQILGMYGQIADDSEDIPLIGRAVSAYLYCPAYTLQGGTSEILKGIVATRGLGLPTK